MDGVNKNRVKKKALFASKGTTSHVSMQARPWEEARCLTSRMKNPLRVCKGHQGPVRRQATTAQKTGPKDRASSSGENLKVSTRVTGRVEHQGMPVHRNQKNRVGVSWEGSPPRSRPAEGEPTQRPAALEWEAGCGTCCERDQGSVRGGQERQAAGDTGPCLRKLQGT